MKKDFLLKAFSYTMLCLVTLGLIYLIKVAMITF